MKDFRKSDPKEMTAPPVCYAVLYPRLVEIAKEHGYALAVHGSMKRDFDLIAVPWIEDAKPALELILAIKEHTGGIVHTRDGDRFFPDCNPTKRPHGRMSYSLHLTDEGCFGPYLDISVMPIVNVSEG